MGQILHGCVRTTAALRRTIQHSQESLSAMAVNHAPTINSHDANNLPGSRGSKPLLRAPLRGRGQVQRACQGGAAPQKPPQTSAPEQSGRHRRGLREAALTITTLPFKSESFTRRPSIVANSKSLTGSFLK